VNDEEHQIYHEENKLFRITNKMTSSALNLQLFSLLFFDNQTLKSLYLEMLKKIMKKVIKKWIEIFVNRVIVFSVD